MEADLILHAFDENLLERVIFSDLQFSSSNYIKTEVPDQQLPLNDHFSELTVNQTKSKSDESFKFDSIYDRKYVSHR